MEKKELFLLKFQSLMKKVSFSIKTTVKFWNCLEISSEGDYFFLGGAEKDSNTACVSAITFDECAELISEKKFSNLNLKEITCLKRHLEGNVVFAGAFQSLLILLWAEEAFSVVNVIETFDNSIVRDIAYKLNSVYLVFGDNRALALYFDDNLIRGRDPKVQPKFQEVSSNRRRSFVRRRSVGSLKKISSYLVEPKSPVLLFETNQSSKLFNRFIIKQIAIPGGK